MKTFQPLAIGIYEAMGGKINNRLVYKHVKSKFNFPFMSGSFHFNRASNDEFSVEFWIFVLIFFQLTLKSGLKEVQFIQNYLVEVKALL